MRFIVKGVNDDRDFCECCGKQGLKRVVWIEDTETGDIKHFGTSCAAAPAKGFDCTKEIKKAIASFDRRQQDIWRMASRAYRAAGGKYEPMPNDRLAMRAVDQPLLEQFFKEAASKMRA